MPYGPLSIEQPHFGKGEDFVRNDFETPFVDLLGPLGIFAIEFAPKSVVDPQINVAPPMTLVFRWWNVGDSALVDFLWELRRVYKNRG